MDAKVTAIILVLFVLHLSSTQDTVLREVPADPHCRCINHTSGYISPRRMKEVEILPSGPHCPRVEIIATLKSNVKVCLNPEAYWVRKLIDIILKNN